MGVVDEWVSLVRWRRPLVTVVIPTYNWATVLPWSIGSVLAQTFTNWELLVVGDGCTDESSTVVEGFHDRRVRWHNLAANEGSQVGPNNAALGLARGTYIAYLGHDDLWLPHHLATLESATRAGARFAHCRQLRIDPGVPPYVSPPADYVYARNDWLAPTSMLHRRDDGLAVGGWRAPDDTSMNDPESDLWLRLAARVGPPVMSADVTSVKLPAALRAGIYRERPCDEQALWWGRITAAPDTSSFLAGALGDGAPGAAERYTTSAPASLQDGSTTARERHQLRRSFKGLNN